MTHSELVNITAEKVQTLFKCGLILKEPKSMRLNFSPDVFAVKKGGTTIQFEIKVSRSDFLKDANKPHRRESLDVGAFRYFVVPWGLVQPDDQFFDSVNMKKWGLIWVGTGSTNRFKIMRGVSPKGNLTLMESTTMLGKASQFRCERNCDAEIELLYSAHRALVLGSCGSPVMVTNIVERIHNDVDQLKAFCSRIR